MKCLSCGGEIEIKNRFTHLAVCDYCGSAIVTDEKAARIAGKMSVLALTDGPLYTTGQGSVKGKRFTVQGRVRYAYSDGCWDEWFLLYEDGSQGWISEDSGNMILEHLSSIKNPGFSFDQLDPGKNIKMQDKSYQVKEKNTAECESAEGQLPFPVVPGEKVPYVDLQESEGGLGSIEFDEDGIKVFLGEAISPSDIKMEMSAEEAGISRAGLNANREADSEHQERVARSDKRQVNIVCHMCGGNMGVPKEGADSITCNYCGNKLDLNLKNVVCPTCQATVPLQNAQGAKSVVCHNCGSHIDTRKDGLPELLSTISKKKRPNAPLKLGAKGKLKDPKSGEERQWEIVGHLRYTEKWDKVYNSDEFLLYNKEAGYTWLIWEEDESRFYTCHQLDKFPKDFDPRKVEDPEDLDESERQRFKFLDKTWTVSELCEGASKITWVEGEMPWVSSIGQSRSYVDSTSGNELLTAEYTDSEIEWFLSRPIDAAQVLSQFGDKKTAEEMANKIKKEQKNSKSSGKNYIPRILFLTACVFGLLSFISLFNDGEKVDTIKLNGISYLNQSGVQTESVNLEADKIYLLKFQSSLDNSWLSLDVEMFNADDHKQVYGFQPNLSYYHGWEGGESWSEGSREEDVVFKTEKQPGSYYFKVYGTAGTTETPDARYARELSITVYKNPMLTRYFFPWAIICFILWFLSLWGIGFWKAIRANRK